LRTKLIHLLESTGLNILNWDLLPFYIEVKIRAMVRDIIEFSGGKGSPPLELSFYFNNIYCEWQFYLF